MAVGAATCDGIIRRTVPYLWARSILSVPAFIARPNASNSSRDVQTRPSTWRLAASLSRNGADYFLEHAKENNNNTSNSRESRDSDELLRCKSAPSVFIVASVLNWTLETASRRLFTDQINLRFVRIDFFHSVFSFSTAPDLSASVPLVSVTSYFRCVTRRRFCAINRLNVCSPGSVELQKSLFDRVSSPVSDSLSGVRTESSVGSSLESNIPWTWLISAETLLVPVPVLWSVDACYRFWCLFMLPVLGGNTDFYYYYYHNYVWWTSRGNRVLNKLYLKRPIQSDVSESTNTAGCKITK